MRKKKGTGVRSAPSSRFPLPPGLGGARAESARPGRWMNVGENGDQDDRVRLGHVRGADGGKSSPPHPLPPTPGGNLRPPPHKASPELAAQVGRGGGGGEFFPPRLSHLCNVRGPSSASEDVCSSFTTRRPRFALPEAPTRSHLVAPAGFPTPFSSAPLCFPQHVRVPGFRPLQSRARSPPLSIQGSVASWEPRTLRPIPLP